LPAIAVPRRLVVALDLLGGRCVEERPERRHLDHFAQAAILAAAPEHDVDDPEAPPDDEGAPEQALHFLGRRVGRDVEVLRPQAEDQIAHGAADDVGLEARPRPAC
jgi:hypothetical protein